jgi:hypothetical protein
LHEGNGGKIIGNDTRSEPTFFNLAIYQATDSSGAVACIVLLKCLRWCWAPASFPV